MTVCPRYDQYKDAWDTKVQVEVNIHSYLVFWENLPLFMGIMSQSIVYA
jgi:hypothetical protein